mgnify:CR=1 FL=1
MQSELKILIHVGEHENIVNILGACTKGLQHASIVFNTYCEIHEYLMSSIPNEISGVTSHAKSCLPDTSEILVNVRISYKQLT